LRVSFPVTEKTGFRLSYSHQVQTPEFTTLMTGVNNDLSFTNTNDVFGRDLKFGKTILFEFGVRHAFSQDLVLDVSAYNKDKVSDYAARILPFVSPRQASETLSVNILTNGDFGNTVPATRLREATTESESFAGTVRNRASRGPTASL